MESDFEQNILEGLAKLKADITKLKSSHKKLSGKVDNFEIQGFHDQIQGLNKRIDELRDVILKAHIQALNSIIDGVRQSIHDTQVRLAQFEMDFLQYHVIQEAEQQHAPSEFRENVLIAYTNALNQAANAANPIKVIIEFRDYLKVYSKEYNVKAFR